MIKLLHATLVTMDDACARALLVALAGLQEVPAAALTGFWVLYWPRYEVSGYWQGNRLFAHALFRFHGSVRRSTVCV